MPKQTQTKCQRIAQATRPSTRQSGALLLGYTQCVGRTHPCFLDFFALPYVWAWRESIDLNLHHVKVGKDLQKGTKKELSSCLQIAFPRCKVDLCWDGLPKVEINALAKVNDKDRRDDGWCHTGGRRAVCTFRDGPLSLGQSHKQFL